MLALHGIQQVHRFRLVVGFHLI